MPKVYESTTTVLLPKETGSAGLLSSLAASTLLTQQLPGLSMPSLTPNRDAVLSILKSRTVAEAVVKRFRLQERYQAVFLQDAIRRLQAISTISVSKEGVISVK